MLLCVSSHLGERPSNRTTCWVSPYVGISIYGFASPPRWLWGSKRSSTSDVFFSLLAFLVSVAGDSFFLFICFYYCSRRFLLYMAALTDPQGRRLYTIQVRYHSFDSVKDILLKFWTEQSSLGCCSFPPLYSEKDLHRSSSASGSLVQVTWEYNWVNKSIFPPK